MSSEFLARLQAIVGVVAPDPDGGAAVAQALLAVCTNDRPDWFSRVESVVHDVEEHGAATGLDRQVVLEAVSDDPEFRWFAALVADLHYADEGTRGPAAERVWASIGWAPGTTADDVDTAALDGLRFAAPGDLVDSYDSVVVGAGAGGGIVAWKLAASGRRVLLVEAGGWPGTADLGRDHLRTPRSSTGLDPLTGPRGDGDPRTLLTSAGRTRNRPGDPGWNANAMLLGGGTRVYGAQAWRFSPHDFTMASRYGVPEGSSLADWPLDYDDLEPYYDEVEWDLGVSGAPGRDPWAGPRRREFPMPPVHETVQSRLLRQGAEALGLGTLPVPLLVNSRPYDGRAACVHCAQCVGFSCPVGAKTGTHNTALPRAVAAGCTVLPGTRVERLVRDARGAVVGVALVGEGPWRRTVRAGEVFLGAGAVESARLLLASPGPDGRTGVGNEHDQVGRHLQGHVYGGASALFADDVVDLVGPGPAIATCDHRHGNEGIVGGGMLANEFVPTPANTFRALVADGFVPPFGRAGQQGMEEFARRLVRVVGPVQEVTSAESRVRLDPTVRDRFGNAVAELSGSVHREDRRGQAYLGRRAEEWLRASGAVAVRRVPAAGGPGPSAGQHQAGTCRMGDDPARSVVDPFGRVWGHENVRVVDASIHVTNGGVNPVLTVLAGAARIADHVVSGRTRRRRG